MKPRDAKWKYSRGSRVTIHQNVQATEEVQDDNDDIEVSDTVESVLGLLLNALGHEATIVR